MDNTNKTKQPSAISNQLSAQEDTNPVENTGDEVAVVAKATNKTEGADGTAALRTSDTPTDNPFSALKEFDVKPKEESKDTKVSKESEVSEEKTNPEHSENSDKPENQNISVPEISEKTGSSDKTDALSPSESSENDEPITKNEPPANPNAKWYVVHTFAGHENKVATALRQRIEAERLENLIYDILVPTQDKIEIRGGKKETVKEKIFPGYILIKMELSDLSWLAVRTTQGVTSFIGAGNKPTPISEAEVATIVKFTTQGAAPTFKDVFMVDDTVKIIDGPFAEFIGKVDSVDKEKGRVRVLVSIFGRETPVELDFLQVQKL